MDTDASVAETSSEKTVASVVPHRIFLIGFSGGGIAAAFPRLITYVSSPDENTIILSFDFILVAALFGLVVGIAMYWMYQGTSDSTRTLFLASLALPSVLSGGVNMANSTNAGQQEINNVVMESRIREQELVQKLSQYMNIPVMPPVEFDRLEDVNLGQSIIPSLLGISTAYAGGDVQAAEETGFNPSVRYKLPKSIENFVIVLDASNDLTKIKDRLKMYGDDLRISNLAVKKSNDTYYIIQQGEMSQSQALLAADELKRQYPQLSPKLLRVR